AAVIAREFGCTPGAIRHQLRIRGWRRGRQWRRPNEETDRILAVLHRQDEPIPWRAFHGHIRPRGWRRAHSALQTLVRKGIVISVPISGNRRAYVLAEERPPPPLKADDK